MQNLQQAIGVLGGTFDPIHFGHLRTAVEIHQALDLAEVRLIPCYQPVHRKFPAASPEQRFEMVECAIKSEPKLRVDDCEIKRKGPSFAIDTLHELHSKFPNTPICIIMGIDAFLNFPSWNRWEEILQLSHLVVAHRPQYQLPKEGIIAELLKKRFKQNPISVHESLAGNIILHPVTALDISATDIRKQIASGRNPRYLLPDSVLDYIQQHGTYSLNQ